MSRVDLGDRIGEIFVSGRLVMLRALRVASVFCERVDYVGGLFVLSF